MSDREYVGCIHVHSRFSDGDAHAAEIIQAASREGLGFLVITDHNCDTLRQEGLTGWHGELLAVSAPEIGRRGRPHFISFGLPDVEPLLELPAAEAIEAARRQGARNFIAHPHPAVLRLFRSTPGGWRHWDTDAFCGIEIWSYMHDICHHLIPWRLPRLWWGHRGLSRGPRPETLAVWDRLCLERRVAAIGALDNHARYVPLLGPALPHGKAFRTVRTHLVCPELPADATQAERALAAALADGQGFVAMDGWADSAGFRFQADGPSGAVGFGGEAAYGPGWTLAVTSPVAADLTVLRNGEAIDTRQACRQMELAAEAPGVYRVEARLGKRPWVFTNPIYLREHVAEGPPGE